MTELRDVDLDVNRGTSGSDRLWRAFYHVMAHGKRPARIFRDEDDKAFILIDSAFLLPKNSLTEMRISETKRAVIHISK